MKVGILTFHFSENYGALFQAYALKKWFEDNDCEVRFVDYRPSYIEDGGKFSLRKPIVRSNLKVIYLYLSRLFSWIVVPSQFRGNKKVFQREMLPVSDILCSDALAIRGTSEWENFDLLVCGSDQIWNPPEHYGVDSAYFLDSSLFGNGLCSPKRISYAPSFGSDSLDVKYSARVAALISNLDAVSVRENSGAEIIRNLCGLNVPVVPDPTLLHTNFRHLHEEYPNIDDKYIFCYCLRSGEGIREVSEIVSRKLKATVYSPHNSHRRWKEIGISIFPSPGQWLKVQYDAKFVVTNSFHGVALSVVQKKEFLYVPLAGVKEKMNARAFNLLRTLNLEDRIVDDLDLVATKVDMPIDWDGVDDNLALLRARGVDYLSEQLSDLKCVEV